MTFGGGIVSESGGGRGGGDGDADEVVLLRSMQVEKVVVVGCGGTGFV